MQGPVGKRSIYGLRVELPAQPSAEFANSGAGSQLSPIIVTSHADDDEDDDDDAEAEADADPAEDNENENDFDNENDNDQADERPLDDGLEWATATGAQGPVGQRAQAAINNLGTSNFGASSSYASHAQQPTPNKTLWFNKSSVRHFMRLCSVASLLSVCANTSKTFSHYPHLMLITFLIDLTSCVVFTLEMVLKINSRSLFDGGRPFARDRWCQFDATMVLFLWASVLLQVGEILHLVEPYSVLSVIRSPRPLILVRFMRVFKFKAYMRNTEKLKLIVKQICERSSQQVYNVTLFFLFFMTLYGLLGVQLFGQIEKHCVMNGTSLEEITINSLAIPDTHCSGSPNYGNQCPPEMVCLDLHLPKEIVGYNGFDHIGHSLYTVYQTSSQEGWAHLMYSTFDHYPAWKVAAYFVSLIFFLGWMVRNVFIAVFTETFNEIRVQLGQHSGQALAGEGVPRVFRGDDSGWKLVEVDENTGTPAWVPGWARRFQNSASFQVIVLLAILANVTLAASIKFEHDGRPREQFYAHTYWWEVGFTIFFNLEVAFKMACLGVTCYWSRTSHRFELLLALGCTLHIVPQLFMTELADFQVLRVIRLIKASPVLEDFAYKSFGPGKKLGSLILFTVCLLVVTSAMTMQLFCSLNDYHRFESFPYAFMSMFQILTQEAWTDIMNETMLRVRDHIGPYVAVYFIMYHLFVSLIVLSLFVAVILDNLELPEQLKLAKQEKAREQIACISEELPMRLRLFERFPDSPQMTKLNKLATSEFNVPKVRESFMRQFVDDIDNRSTIKNCLRAGMMPKANIDFLTGAKWAYLSGSAYTESTGASRSIGTTGGGGGGGLRPHTALSSSVRRSLKSKLRQANLSLGGGGGGHNYHHQPGGSRLQLTRKVSPSNLQVATSDHEKLIKHTQDAHTKQQPPAKLTRFRPSLKLLTGPPKSPAPKRELLRKSTITQLIEESNLQRMSLMSDDFLLGRTGGASSGSLSATGSSSLAGQTGSSGGSQLRYRGTDQRLGSMGATQRATATTASTTGQIHQSTSYDYLRENGMLTGGGGPGELEFSATRNPHEMNIKMLKRKRQQAELKRSQRERDLRENHPLFDTPLFIVGRESRIRKFCQLLAWSKYTYNERDPITGKLRKSSYKSLYNLLGLVSYFDWLMLVVTTLSCISMMFETPTMRVMNTPALRMAEYTFVAAMSLELTLKVIANGLVFTPKALLSTVAGALDTFIFISSLVYALWMPQEVEPQSLAQYLMLLRCIRPLRVFSLIPHMRQVVYELVRGFKAIFLVCILLGLLCFVFACYGVHIFGGRLARCTDPTVATRENCTGTFLRKVFVTKMRVPTDDQTYPALLVPRVWANPHRFSFDDIKSAMLALFEVLSFKGWVDIREALLKRFDNSLHWLYIHIFVFFGCMVGVTLFVGVVIANYGENKGTGLLTVEQRRWCDLKKRLKIAQPLHLPPRPDHIKCRAIIYDIIQHIVFKRLIAFLVLCNSSLLIVHWDPDESHTLSFATVSACLTCAFTIEVCMKTIAFTPRGYWQSRRNRYDLVVTLIGCIWVLVHFVFTTNALSNSFGFVVVILRFFTITGKHATLQMLMLTVVVSVYKSFFIILGLFVLVLFYSLLGVQLFGSVKYGENLSRQANFRSAKLGTITMFRIVTGEDWYRMMHDCMIMPPYCTKGKNYWETDCGHLGISFAFFSSFYIIITHIVLNLLVAIIMENFSLFYSSDSDALLSYTDIRHFQSTWNMVDIQQRGSIPVRYVKFILGLLRGSLEVEPDLPRMRKQKIKEMCHEMERLHNSDDVSFHDVLTMIAYRTVDDKDRTIVKSLQFEELLARLELQYIIREEVAKKTIRSWLDQCLRRLKQERLQANSLIQGLRLTNLGGIGGADPFLLSPLTTITPTSSQVEVPASTTGQMGPPTTGGTSSGLGQHSPQTPRRQNLTVGSFNLTAGGPTTTTTTTTTLGGGGQRMASSSTTSDSQHSITSAATIATIAASIGKLKRRVEASRSESVSAAGTGGGGAGGATGSTGGQRKLLSSHTPADHKKEERTQQLRRVIKALTNPGHHLTSNKTGGPFSLAQAPELFTATMRQQETTNEDEDEARRLKQQQYLPKLNSAINDIHQWWDFQITD